MRCSDAWVQAEEGVGGAIGVFGDEPNGKSLYH